MHFQRAAPEKLPHAINRYRREAARHYQVLEDHLAAKDGTGHDGTARDFIVGGEYTIADISAWGWVDRAQFVFFGDEQPLAPFPHIRRWFQAINSRPVVAQARRIGTDHAFKKEQDEEAKRHLYPSNYPGNAAASAA